MKFILLLSQIFGILYMCRSWEYCQADVQSQICKNHNHFVCDPSKSVADPSCVSKEFLGHAPLTRKVKTAFLNWHNYYRNRTAGGWVKRKQTYFPKAARMRELIWDNELSYLSHVRTKLVNDGEVACRATQRFPDVGQNLIVKGVNEHKAILAVIALSITLMFKEKKHVKDPVAMPKQYSEKNQFANIVNDRASRLGCAIALGADCKDKKQEEFKFCYYTVCTYDSAVGNNGVYKIGKPARRCSHWETGKSKVYKSLCKNTGKIFDSHY